MRKIIFFVTLVIILVSLNWFRELTAQDLSNVSDEQRAELMKLYKSRKSGVPDKPRVYKTPEIYEDSANFRQNFRNTETEDSTELSTLARHLRRKDTAAELGKKKLPAFEDLKVFGMELFEGAENITQPVDIATTSDYVLGPGDNVLIYLWGRVEKEYNLTIDREGKIFVPQVGELVVWGLTLEQFKARAIKQFSKVYSDYNLTISLGKIRSIRIFVTGEVKRPGAYTVSSLTSLFNAIYTAGGPNQRGSMRNIKLMRSGKEQAVVDLYKFLLEGDNSIDVRLQTGDLIFVPVAGTRVAIRGEVKRQAIYELTGKETALDILALAGQPTAEAHLDRVMLERVSGKSEWEVLDLNLNQAKGPVDAVVLQDGDRITVASIFDFKHNMVSITGHVKHPGFYERNDSTRVSDLLKRAQLQPYDVYYDRAELYRRHANNRTQIIPIDLSKALAGDEKNDLKLKDLDSLHVYSIKEIEWDRIVYIEGEVKRPGVFDLYEGMSVEDLIFLAGSFKRSAFRFGAEIARVDSVGRVEIIYVNLRNPAERKILMQEDDQLFIRRIPDWKENRTVKIEGEVTYPGEYAIMRKDETLYNLLARCGGFTERAFPKGLIFVRHSIEENLRRLGVDKMIERSKRVVEDSLGNVRYEGMIEYDPKGLSRIVIEMEAIMNSGGAVGDIMLEPNDKIFVPSVPSGVSVMGAVGSNGTIQFMPNKKVSDYIKRAGNFTRWADKHEVRLIRASGEVYSGGTALGKKVELGDLVVVPTKVEKKSNWFKNLTTAASAITGIVTTAILIGKL
ncbi:MAG: SLBB domain-containing protein [candidate division Zixibacteria bacterium]|nr:SLBB domain-containing protein [candidate division Zixibacteria bacterium]